MVECGREEGGGGCVTELRCVCVCEEGERV